MRYKLLGMDLDGTLLRTDKTILPQTIQAIHQAISSGTTIALASGRPLASILPVASELSLGQYGGYIIGTNGGIIFDCKNQNFLLRNSIPADIIRPIQAFAAENRVALLGYRDGQIFTSAGTDPYVLNEAAGNRCPVNPVDDLASVLTDSVEKLMLFAAPEKLQDVFEPLHAAWGAQAHIFFSESYSIEVVPHNADKSSALIDLAHHLGFAAEQVMACGDALNDIDMLQAAGFGVAMGNAYDEVKRIADFITRSNDDDGIGYAIRECLLKT